MASEAHQVSHQLAAKAATEFVKAAAEAGLSWADIAIGGETTQGETPEELQRDLIQMLANAYKWMPVPLAHMKVGMTFQRTGIDVETMIRAMAAAKGRLL